MTAVLLAVLLAAPPVARRDVLETLFDEPQPTAGEVDGVPIPVAAPTVRPDFGELDEDAVEAAAAALAPGGELVLPDGRYRGVKLALTARGREAAPVVIRPATPGGVTFTGSSRIDLKGEWIVFRGFRFEHCLDSTALQLVDCSRVRVTQCGFVQCGKPTSTFGHIVELGLNCDDCRVDHCYFSGSRSMSLAQRVTHNADNGLRNRFDSNLFRDVFRYWVNGQENVQLGQNQRSPTGDIVIDALVERNLFDHAWGDSEVISNKCSGNTIRHNTAAWCQRSSFTLRGGDGVRFEANQMIGCGNGLRVMGRRHTITGNLFWPQIGPGIVLETGSAADDMQVATVGTRIAGNAFVDCRPALAGMAPSDGRPHPPREVTFADNLLLGEGTAVDETHLGGVTQTGNRTTGAPPAAPAECPPIPPAPVLDVAMHLGERLVRQDPDEPGAIWRGESRVVGDAVELGDGLLEVNAELPDEVVIQFEHQSDAYADVASLALVDPAGAAYETAWGGADPGDGKPDGIIELRRRPTEEPVTLAADVMMYRQDYVYQGWMNRTNITAERPNPERWSRFTLIRRGGRLILLQGNAASAGAGVPVLVWQDPLPPLEPTGLAVTQLGRGRFRGLTVWRYVPSSPDPPATPTAARADSRGPGHLALSWESTAPGLRYRVTRAGRIVAEELTAAGCDLFAVDGAGRYQVVAIDTLGRESAPAEIDATPAMRGGWYAWLPAESARVVSPLVLSREGATPFVRNAAGDSTMTEPPGDGTTFEVTVPVTGDYAVWGLVRTDDDGSDSFHIACGGPSKIWYTGVHAGWTWVPAIERVRLVADGRPVTVTLKPREPRARLAGLLVTNDTDFTPAGSAGRR